jgi:hypothetical protein
MKRVDTDGFTIVHCGEPWGHDALPCSRSMIRHLERNESVVTWLQVRTLGSGKGERLWLTE